MRVVLQSSIFVLAFFFSVAAAGSRDEDAHYDYIYSHYPNADSIYESQAFNDWLSDQPDSYNVAMDRGSAEEVVAVFDAFKTEIRRLLARTGSHLSENLPVMLDANTRLDTVNGIGGGITYMFTLINDQAEDVQQMHVSSMKKSMVSQVCANEELAYLLHAGAPFQFVYRDREGLYSISITTKASDCP